VDNRRGGKAAARSSPISFAR